MLPDLSFNRELAFSVVDPVRLGLVNVGGLLDAPCFCDSFSYKGFTFFKYLRITSLAVELTRFTEPCGVVFVMVSSLGSLRNTEENLESEKYLGFLLVVVGVEWRRRVRELGLEVSSSVTELGRREESRESGKSEEELAVE